MCKEAKARIAYTGPALENGAMDVKDLAPALIAFAELVENASHAIGLQQNVRVMLNQDSINKGSFDITFVLGAETILEQAKLIMGWADESGFKDLMEVLGWPITSAAGYGIFKLVKWVKGRTVTGIKHRPDGNAEITVNDADKIVVAESTLKVFLDVNCRINLEKVVKPLKTEGIDSFELRNPDKLQDKTAIESIPKEDLIHFKAPSAKPFEDEIPEPLPEQEILVRIVLINFEDGKWKFTDGTNTFWATMDDEVFNAKVKHREISFASGDMLKIRYRIQQLVKNGTLSSEYKVTKVIEIRKRPQQIALGFDYKEE